MAKFDLSAMVGDLTRNSQSKTLEQIDLTLIDADPRNFYQTDDVSDLVNSIAMGGLRQPLDIRVHPDNPDRYMVISGHRRRKALLQLVSEGREDLRTVPCMVDRSKMSEALSGLLLILGNSSTRVISGAELLMQADAMREYIYQLEKEGHKFPGRVREIVAEACNTTSSKLARLEAIRNNCKPAIFEAYNRREISEHAAYQLSQLSGCEQDYFSRSLNAGVYKTNPLTGDRVKNSARNMGEATRICNGVTCPRGGRCSHLPTRLLMATQLSSSINGLNCTGCCIDCHNLISCKHSCAEARTKKAELKQTEKAAEQEAERRTMERIAPSIERLRKTWEGIAELLEDGDTTAKFFSASIGYSSSSDIDMIAAVKAGTKKWAAYDDYPARITRMEAERLSAAADLLGVSIDFLLGHETAKKGADGWCTGRPAAPGWYIARIVDGDYPDAVNYLRSWYGGKNWKGIEEPYKVTHWMPEVEE